ncbi:MAG: 2,3-bisphosphoglycerate-independent phosphoglycerate mutase [Pirellulaceae bacterium]|nr:MAG: 2,3-bisphosphoglycerate-independent phosphoglycerate mutase [Pirellulaceae bacterium]
MQLAWLSDLHLEMVDDEERQAFIEKIGQLAVDAFLIGGDIGIARNVVSFLRRMAEHWQRPIYFVLGNHDYYLGAIRQVREAVRQLCREQPRLVYLSQTDYVLLNRRVALVGHDGWADGREGNYEASDVMLYDYKLIAELEPYSKAERRKILEALADETVKHLEQVVPAALRAADHLYFLTHVPPWREACWHRGRLSDDEWAPHFTCQVAGRTLRRLLDRYPDKQLTVLCGHTHSEGYARVASNIEAFTASARYGDPTVYRILELAD